MTEAIRDDGLVKAFGHTSALDGLDLTVRTGEMHGFLGPNGAGKTTTTQQQRGVRASGSAIAAARGSPPSSRAGRGSGS